MINQNLSIVGQLAALPDAERRRVLATFTPEELEAIAYAWPIWARPDQLSPAGDWRTWLLLGGRGSGKTRSSAEATRAEVEAGRRRSIGLIGPTSDTLRRDQVETLLRISPPWCQPNHDVSKRTVTWPNGSIAYLLSSEEPDRIRGLNLDFAWCDELTSWSYSEECWANLQMALRVPGPTGADPAAVVSTTPKRHALLKRIVASASTAITRSKTFDNAANLSAATIAHLRETYGGTTLGRQELDAELLDDVDGALWHRDMLDAGRVMDDGRQYRRIVVAIDPAGSSNKNSDETGLIVAAKGINGEGYILQDLSGRFTPERWARRAVEAYYAHAADRIVVENNFGGDMVVATIRAVDASVPVKIVHASRGKQIRAEPVVALYEQGKIHHVGMFLELEDQLCGWDPNESKHSPDRLDALVWALTELMITAGSGIIIKRLPY